MKDIAKPSSQGNAEKIELQPANSDTGFAKNADFRVHIERKVFDDIAEFSRSDTEKELGGILLGQVLKNQESTLVLIEGHVVAHHTEAQKGSVTFTHDSWSQMHKDKETSFPLAKIVGWFHTHPGFGIFLSSYDKFIQNNFFNLPWQIAYVVDPLNRTEGFFRSENNNIAAVQFRIVEVPSGQAPPVSHPVDPPKAARRSKRKKSRTVSAAEIAVVLLLVCSMYFWFDDRRAISRIGELRQSVSNLEYANKILADQVSNKRCWRHAIRPGETLTSISSNFYGSEKYVDDIARLNKIADTNSIQVGQELLIPEIAVAGGAQNE